MTNSTKISKLPSEQLRTKRIFPSIIAASLCLSVYPVYALSDSDNDGTTDRQDNCVNVSNHGQWDKDKDGIGNECDNDIDGDGFSNEEETLAGTKPWDSASFPRDGENEDSDGDGVSNDVDNCPSTKNQGQWDKDGDGIGNECDDDIDGDSFSNQEEELAGTLPWNAKSYPSLSDLADADNDGIADLNDNCPNVANKGQWDKDGDNIGNKCDDDIDGDGYTNQQELMAGTIAWDLNSFPSEQTLDDRDGDGLSNGQDNCPDDANAGQWDRDSDGIGNECDSDIDGDGVSNEEEMLAGSNPWDFNSVPDIHIVDEDQDGIADDQDNCPSISNVEQIDLDNDGFGDDCDDDIDGDGIANVIEDEKGSDPYDAHSQPQNIIYAINAGGGQYIAANGIAYSADGYSKNGKAYTTLDTISGTDDQVLYQSEAWGENLKYELPVSNGTYNIRLKMAENYHESAGLRKQDIIIEGSKELSGLDLVADAGHDVAIDYKIDNVNVSDGVLDIEFNGAIDAGKVSAIVVSSQDGQAKQREFNEGVSSRPFYHAPNRIVLRIPALIKTKTGRIFAGIEQRETWSDHADKEVAIVYSDDSGKNWTGQVVLGDAGSSPVGNPTFVYDNEAERLFLFYARYDGSEHSAKNKHVYYRVSDNNGSTWSKQLEVTHLIPNAFSLLLPGPGHGIQLKYNQDYKGRLVLPFWGYKSGKSTIGSLYSDDHGTTWHYGYESSFHDSSIYAPNESEVIEKKNGDVMVIARTAIEKTEYGGGMVRAKAFSKDGGKSIGPLTHSSQFSGPIVMGSVERVGDRLLYSSPLHSGARENLGFRESFNDGQSWGLPKQITNGFSAYSDLVALDDDTFGVIYEVNNYKDLDFKTFNLSSLNAKSVTVTDNSSTQSQALIMTSKSRSTSALFPSGKFGTAVHLDGNSHVHVTKTETNKLTGDFSLNFWYRSEKSSNDAQALTWFYTLGSARDGFWTRLESNRLRGVITSGGESVFEHGSNTAGDNQWHMFSLVRRGNDADVYIDGDIKASMNNAFEANEFGRNTDLGYLFGQRPNNKAGSGFVEGFHGSLDEIKLYNRALTDSEIDALQTNSDVDDSAKVLDISFD